jgi:tripartite-type tricarboxylate transporter receptor subunit TctC
VHQIVATPSVQAELARQGVRSTGYPSAHFGGLLRTESQKFAALVKATGLKAE